MKPVDRQKMCSNCDGRIPYDALQCPYCFTQQQVDASPSKNLTPSSDPLSSLYPPPYSARPIETPEVKTTTKTGILPDHPDTETTTVEAIPFWAILMLTLGGNLFTLGLLQFFFSDHGVLYLEMNASYWFLMVLVALPLIYFGLKSLATKK